MKFVRIVAVLAVFVVLGRLIGLLIVEEEKGQRLSEADSAEEPTEKELSIFEIDELMDDVVLEPVLDYPPGAINDELVIHFDNLSDYQAFIEAMNDSGYTVLGQIDPLLALRVSTRSLRAVDPRHFGARSSFSYTVQRPSLPVALDPSALSALRGFGVSAREITEGGPGGGDGTGVTVAVLDSGIELHPQLEQVDIQGLDLSGEGISGNGSEHGTSVASIIAGTEGIAPNADLFVVRVFDEVGAGSSYDVAQGIVEAVDQGAKIVNMSLGLYQDAPVLREAVNYAAENDVLLVAAAGNDAVDFLPYPAAYDEVIAVTAVDALGQQAIFPNQSTQIDYAAPGVGVYAADEEDGVSSFSGTSAAAPFVSGTLASLMSGEGPLTPQAAVDFLDRFSNEAGAPGDDPQYGGGVLDWDRMKEHQTNGVADVALASVYIPPETLPGTLAAVDVTIENRGTQWLNDAELQILAGDQEIKTYPVSSLAVGETATRRVYAEVPSASEEEQLQIHARVVLDDAQSDVRIENNTTSVRFVPAPRP